MKRRNWRSSKLLAGKKLSGRWKVAIKAVLHNYDLFKVELGSERVYLCVMSLVTVEFIDQTFDLKC